MSSFPHTGRKETSSLTQFASQIALSPKMEHTLTYIVLFLLVRIQYHNCKYLFMLTKYDQTQPCKITDVTMTPATQKNIKKTLALLNWQLFSTLRQ